MSLRDDLLPTVESLRQIPGVLGLRQHTVAVVVEKWSGSRPGQGTVTATATPIMNGDQPPKVVQVSQRDIVASGGLYQDGDLKVGPITPEHALGGVTLEELDPTLADQSEQVFYSVIGPLCPDGARFRRIGRDFSRAFGLTVFLRREATLEDA